MAVNSVRSPFPAFLDTDGNALEGGKIYIGTISTNPITTPKAVYWDEALTIPASQPIRTVGGLPVRNNSPARFYVENDYAIAVYTTTDTLVYSADVDISETAPSVNNYVTIATAGPATDLDVAGKEVVLCDTSGNDVALSGFTGGVTGQSIRVVKTSSSNDLTLNHNASTGNQDMFLFGGASATVDATYSVSGGVDLLFDGTIWRQVANDVAVSAKRMLTITAAGPTDDLDVTGVNVVLCDTSSNSITIGGTVGAVTGQELTIVKGNASNDLTVEHNEGTGNQDFLNFDEVNWTVSDSAANEAYGGFRYVFNGTAWLMSGGIFTA